MSSGSLPLSTYHRASHLGDGSFGSVVVVYNDDGEEFALKLFIMSDIESDDSDEEDDDDSTNNAGRQQKQQPMELGALREISCLRLLRENNKHPNIVELQDVQTDWQDEEDEGGGGAGTSGCLGMALPLFPMGSVAKAIQAGTFQGYPKIAKVQIAHGLLSAVAFLHDNCGIIHRDIKTDNILLEHYDDGINKDNGQWKPILIDFSLAKPINGTLWDNNNGDCCGQYKNNNDNNECHVDLVEEESIRHTGEVGTVVYTSPEIVHRQGYGFPSDLYSVGVVLLELLRNSLFTAEKAKEATMQIETALQSLPSSAPFPHLLRHLLDSDPGGRPSAREALLFEIFGKFGLRMEREEAAAAAESRRKIRVATALPYDDEVEEEDVVAENESPNATGTKSPTTSNRNHNNNKKTKRPDKKLQRRLKLIDKILHQLDAEHPRTRSAALEYSQQMEQMDDEIDDVENSQTLTDCCILAAKFWELHMVDLDDLKERSDGPIFSNWSLETYIDNEATIFMILDFCLYPRNLLSYTL